MFSKEFFIYYIDSMFYIYVRLIYVTASVESINFSFLRTYGEWFSLKNHGGSLRYLLS